MNAGQISWHLGKGRWSNQNRQHAPTRRTPLFPREGKLCQREAFGGDRLRADEKDHQIGLLDCFLDPLIVASTGWKVVLIEKDFMAASAKRERNRLCPSMLLRSV